MQPAGLTLACASDLNESYQTIFPEANMLVVFKFYIIIIRKYTSLFTWVIRAPPVNLAYMRGCGLIRLMK